MKYRNIAISGGIATGTTTLLRNLLKELEPQGWQGKSTGQMVREYLKENVMPMSSNVSDDMNKQIEANVMEVFTQKEHWIIEGWLAGFVARDIPSTLKILVHCSDFHVRVDRISNREDLTIDQATENIHKREGDMNENFKKLYGEHDFHDPKYFDIVIDTLTVDQHTARDMILKALSEE